MEEVTPGPGVAEKTNWYTIVDIPFAVSGREHDLRVAEIAVS